MRHRLAVLGAGLLLLAACDYTPSALGDWRERPSCGSFENRNREPSAKQKAATRCLLDAFARGRPAELVATYHTIEGDPWAEYYRVLGPRRVEVFVNASDDRYANTGWAHWICSGLAYADSIDQFVREGCRAISVDEVVTAGYG